MGESAMKRNRWRKSGKRRPDASLLERINPDVAGIDLGSAKHYVAVPVDRDPDPVRSFDAFTEDLHRMADWLAACGVKTVAMEATGVYWIAVYEILEERGFEVLLVNARHVKNVAGRKTDVTDCEWVRDLHSVGLLRGSFRPADDIVALRSYQRHRDSLVDAISQVVQRMQKALVQMNVQLPRVVTDVTGKTGMAIMKDIVAGRTDPEQLAQHRDCRCHASVEQFVAALTGNYRAEHIFVLRQNLELFAIYHGKLVECDRAIEGHLSHLIAHLPAPTTPHNSKRRKRTRNEPAFAVQGYLHRLTGVDLSLIDGLGPYSALQLISEIGTDMSRWPSPQHFASWLGLAPQNKISGGRLLRSGTTTSANRAANVFRLAAMSAGRTETALGAFHRRLAIRVGKAKAITATARKLAMLVYRMIKGELIYDDPGPDAYHKRQQQRALRNLRRRAAYLGFALVDIETGELQPT